MQLTRFLHAKNESFATEQKVHHSPKQIIGFTPFYGIVETGAGKINN